MCPQLPQFAESFTMSVHSLLHGTIPVRHVSATHIASSQCSVAAHACPHSPQCLDDARVSTQPPVSPSAQSVWSASHTVVGAESVPEEALDDPAPELASTNEPPEGLVGEQAKRSPEVMQATTTVIARVRVDFMTLRFPVHQTSFHVRVRSSGCNRRGFSEVGRDERVEWLTEAGRSSR
jgi:hypothetical protein